MITVASNYYEFFPRSNIMSVFKVNLDQGTGRTAQGFLDTAIVSGASIQRSVWLPGPNKTNRQLFDGATFTDVNYFKRYTYPTVPQNQAILSIVSDDGSVWYDNSVENSFPRGYSLTVADNSAYAANVIDVVGDNGSAATFTEITVTTGGTAPTFRFNGLSNALYSIGNGVTQIFDHNDLLITKIEIDNTQSGHASATVKVLMGIKSVAKS